MGAAVADRSEWVKKWSRAHFLFFSLASLTPATATATADTTAAKYLMGRLYQHYLTGDKVYCCAKCGTHLSTTADIISKVPHPLFFLSCRISTRIREKHTSFTKCTHPLTANKQREYGGDGKGESNAAKRIAYCRRHQVSPLRHGRGMDLRTP